VKWQRGIWAAWYLPIVGLGRHLVGEPRLQPRTGMPVKIEERLPVRPPVLRVPEPAPIAEQQRLTLHRTIGAHAADHIAQIRVLPADTARPLTVSTPVGPAPE